MPRLPKAPQWPKTLTAAAAALGWDRTVLHGYIARGAPGKTGRGFDLDALRAWKDANVGPPRGNGATEEKTGDQARLLKAQADEREAKAALADLRLSIERGEYLPIAEVKERDIARVTAVKRGLLAFEKSLSPRLVGLEQTEISVVVKKAVRDLLEKFSRM